MKSLHSPFSRLALIVAVSAGMAVPLMAQQKPGPNDPVFRRISDKLLCQCGNCNYMVLSCNHVDCPSATYIRSTVQNDLAQGKSEDVIVASFVQQYGPKILSEPPRHGFTWLAWLMPFIGLGLGMGAVFFVLSKWSRRSSEPSLASGPSAAPTQQQAALLEKYRTQIDREIEKD